MTVASGAPTRLGGSLNQNTYIVLATKAVQLIRAVFSFFGTTIASCYRWLVRLITALVMSAIFVLGGVAIAIPLNQWHNERNNSIYQQTAGTFVHTDKRTTAILSYLTGHGPLPREEVLVVTRLYVKNLLEEAEMEVPQNINSLTMKE